MARRSVRSAVAASCLLLAPRLAAQVPFPEEAGFHNTTYVGDEPEAARLAFYRAEEHRLAGREREAGREILRLLRGPASGPVRFSERLAVPVETAALLFLLRLPAEVRAELGAEEAALEPPRPVDGDPEALRRFAARHPLSPRGQEAWLRAGTLSLLRGEAGVAAADLERVVHWPSALATGDDGGVRPLAAARLLQAQVRLTEPPAEGGLARWPLGASVLRRGEEPAPIGELLDGARSAGAGRPADATTLLGDDARAARPDVPRTPLRLRFVLAGADPADRGGRAEQALHRWRFRLATELPSEAGRADAEIELKDLPFLAPLVIGDRLISIERDSPEESAPASIHVRRLADGRDRFAPIRSDFDLHLDPRVASVAIDRAALSVRGDRLLATFELRDPPFEAREFLRSRRAARTALFALDLRREGYVESAVTSADLAGDPRLAGFIFAGPAVELAGGRVVVAASRLVNKETECALLAFDAATGAPAGRCLLARAAAIPRVGDRFVEEETRRVLPSPVALRDGTLYVCTNLGVIAAVRAADLETQWVFRYHRITPPESDRYERAAKHDLPPWIGRPPVALADRVLATPSDSLYLYSLARWPDEAGNLLLNDPIEKQARICWLGADERECWFLKRIGARGGPVWTVQATDHDGSHHWETPPLGGVVTGVPALSLRFLFVPTDRCIYRVDLEREGFVDAIPPPREVGIPYPEFGIFGDLAAAEGCLLSSSRLFTLAFAPGSE